MAQYIVRSGQNIYDVAITLHGSVEGIFDILISNPWLNLETSLKFGMTIDYHEDFTVNEEISTWLKANGIIVKNGDHTYNRFEPSDFIIRHITQEHPEIVDYLQTLSPDEQNIFWDDLCIPRMIICQQGIVAKITVQLKPGAHLFIDWGDYTAPQIFENTQSMEIEHLYKSGAVHNISFYGDCLFEVLDLSKISGSSFPLQTIVADTFMTIPNNEKYNTLIVSK